ncbi:MAG: hypothetical protein WA188_14980 [Terriglobales bacterium]
MNSAAASGSKNAMRALLFLWVMALAAAPSVRAQTTPVERSFHASKAVVESKLRGMGAYAGGRLPILEGFVVSKESSLDRYQRGYYQYSVQLSAAASGETQVRVTAKITAWYAASDPSHSGYRVLPSNGRLEADLLDRLQQELPGAAAVPPGMFSSMPDKPAPAFARGSAIAGAPGLTASLSLRRQPGNSFPASNADEQRVPQLREELKNLQEILKNQTRPGDLAAVKSSNTPILASPMEGAQVVLRAESEDEFQILEIKGTWVHVRISGLSRGWIQRSQLEMSAGFESASQSADISQLTDPSFRKSREETSTFPGNWEPLQGKKVKIIWVQPLGDATQGNRVTYAKSVFHQTYSELSQGTSDVSGVVIVFDSKDGGMAAATVPALQQWAAGHLSDNAFWKRCWFDPADAFNVKE